MAAYGKRNAVIVDGQKLTEARIAANMRMEDIAVRLRCNKGSVSKWEQGRLVPSEERIGKLVKLLGTDSFVRWNPNYKIGRKR